MKKRLLTMLALPIFVASLAMVTQAKPSEYDLIVRHLKQKYQAKKVNIPFIFLARAAVSMVRPAGVKSFSITLFKDLQFSRENLDVEMQAAMRSSFGEEWQPIFHVRSREGQQAYMYMRESNNCVRIALVTIDKEQAAVIRATFNPDKLADFINNPKIFGISLVDKHETNENPPSQQRIEQLMHEKKGMYPNVDFYSASTYYLMGIPLDLFTPIFAVSRISGWTGHILEQYANNKVIRPRAEYIGQRDLKYVPINER